MGIEWMGEAGAKEEAAPKGSARQAIQVFAGPCTGEATHCKKLKQIATVTHTELVSGGRQHPASPKKREPSCQFPKLC